MKDFFFGLKWRYTDFSFSVKQKWQRFFRGYADSDLWNMDGHLSEYLYVMMDRFIKSKRMGYPAEFGGDMEEERSEEKEGRGMEEWEEILCKIREGFKAAQDVCEENFDWDKYPVDDEDLDLVCGKKIRTPEQEKQTKERYEQYDAWYKDKRREFEEGMDLFKKYFFALWD